MIADMFFAKPKCKKCDGTGVQDLQSYSVGTNMFSFFLELILPVAIFVVPLYILFLLGVSLIAMLYYWHLLALFACLLLLVSIWLISPLVKGWLFGKCKVCGGSGRMKVVG